MRKYLPIVLLLGCAAAFAFGLEQLFELRFASGDVYPACSSLRSDPLGTMAFYESLAKMPGLATSRDFRADNRLPEERATVYLHLAASPFEWEWVPADLHREIKDFLARGGRLVITFSPQTEAPRRYDWDDEDATNAMKSAPPKARVKKLTPDKPVKKKKIGRDDEPGVSLNDEWGFHEGFVKLAQNDGEYEPIRVKKKTDLPLPPSLDWHSGMVFTNCAGSWRTIYARDTNAVMIERAFGRGSVVMAGDSYFLSNEALARDRHADLLAWLAGPSRNIVFDEGHFGIVDTSGVAGLMRKYRLHGLAAALILLAGLFVWKNSTSLLPPRGEEQPDEMIAGKDAASGFVNLLRRSIAPRDLLAACFAEWKKSTAATGQFSAARRQQAEIIFQTENSAPARARNPVAAYQNIAAALGNQKQKS